MSKHFTVYPGKFSCKICQEEVKTMRLWTDDGKATWMCSKKHLSTVELIATKKTKKDYEREKRK